MSCTLFFFTEFRIFVSLPSVCSVFSCLLISITFPLSSLPLVSFDVWDKVNSIKEEQKQTITQYIAAQLVILIFLRIRVGLTWAKVAPPLFPRSRCLDNLRRPTLFFLTQNLFSLFNLIRVPEKSNQVAHDVLEAFSLQCFFHFSFSMLTQVIWYQLYLF